MPEARGRRAADALLSIIAARPESEGTLPGQRATLHVLITLSAHSVRFLLLTSLTTTTQMQQCKRRLHRCCIFTRCPSPGRRAARDFSPPTRNQGALSAFLLPSVNNNNHTTSIATLLNFMISRMQTLDASRDGSIGSSLR